MFLHRL